MTRSLERLLNLHRGDLGRGALLFSYVDLPAAADLIWVAPQLRYAHRVLRHLTQCPPLDCESQGHSPSSHI